MGFSKLEKQALLELKGVGPTVVSRLEEIGICSFAELGQYRAEDIAEMVASMLGSTCWKNSPPALEALRSATQLARSPKPVENEQLTQILDKAIKRD